MGDDENEELSVRVPLREYEVMVAAVAALADIKRGDKIVVDKAKFEELLKVSEQVDKMLGKFDDMEKEKEALLAPSKRQVPPSIII